MGGGVLLYIYFIIAKVGETLLGLPNSNLRFYMMICYRA